jgi:predicted secreted hydrolase
MRFCALVCALVVGTSIIAAASAEASTTATAETTAAASPPPVQLPKDEAPHSAPVEWWYFSGHLTGVDAAGHEHTYGFEYVTFQLLGEAAEPVYDAQFSLTDLTRGTFQFGGEAAEYPVPATTDSFALHTGKWTMSGGSGSDKLHASLAGYSLTLNLTANEPAVLHGSHGYIPMGPFGTSAYYSYTSLLSSGTIIDHGVTVKVTGISWMDHQWGAIDFASGGGWDWFSMQLSNGQQYMLYFIRDKAGKIVKTVATRVDCDGTAAHLAAGTFSEKATGSWTSPATGITYSSGWQVTVPGGHLTVTPDLVDQEVNLYSTQGFVYWEGDSAIKGVIDGKPVHGKGYTEINPSAAA